MANYTIKNLREAEDMAPKFGLSPDMEARFPGSELGLEATGLSLQRLAPDATQPFGHSHQKQEEVYLVLEGSGRVKLDDEIVELRKWDAIRIAPEVTRAVSAGPDGMEYLAFGATEGSSAAEDAQPKPGWWDGAGAGV
jgi:mannose-6-phosphate isomerase-like protein (cupin superfamily)